VLLAVEIDMLGRIERDLLYARGGAKALLLDLYLPQTADHPCPVVVWVHGGAFREGSKEDCPATWLAPRGYAVASINYRLSQEAIFPAQLADCKAAVRWLRAHAGVYGLDAAHIGAWGSSAGGHLVAMLGATAGQQEFEGTGGHLEHSSRVQAVCDFFGPTDFLQMDAAGSTMCHDAADSPESQLVGGPIQENVDRVARANPITYVTGEAPPFLIVHGTCDPLVPYNQSELLYAALRQAGVEVTLRPVEGAGHGFEGPEFDALVAAFFDRHLKTV
jgi:acetyl esterase/lipase